MAKRKSTRNVPAKDVSSERTARKRGRDDTVASSSRPLKKRGKTVKSEPSEEKFKSRMSPSSLYQFINSDPSEAQVRDIKDIGFGGLLQVSTDEIPGELAKWLVRNFDPRQCSLMKGQLRLEDVDVHLATGLPIGPLEVKEASKRCNDASFLELKKKWLEQFGDVTDVPRTALLEKLKSQRGGGDDFKRNFIVFLMSTFLMGTNSNTVSARILLCLGDLSRVHRYNWCLFTLRHLSLSVRSWQENKEKGKYYTGPIMVLVYMYLDRVVHCWRSVPRVFPTLSRWTKAEISSRVAAEFKDGFGTGAIHDRIPHVLPLYEDEVGVSSPVVDEADESRKDVMDQVKNAALDFAKSYTSLSVVVNKAEVVDSNCKFVNYMTAFLKGISDGYRCLGQNDFSSDDNDDNFDVVIHEFDKSFGAPRSSYRESMKKAQGESEDMDQKFDQHTANIPSPGPRPIHSLDFKLTACNVLSEARSENNEASNSIFLSVDNNRVEEATHETIDKEVNSELRREIIDEDLTPVQASHLKQATSDPNQPSTVPETVVLEEVTPLDPNEGTSVLGANLPSSTVLKVQVPESSERNELYKSNYVLLNR